MPASRAAIRSKVNVFPAPGASGRSGDQTIRKIGIAASVNLQCARDGSGLLHHNSLSK